MIPIGGIGRPPAIVALVIYALFPILQNTYTGLTEIDPGFVRRNTAEAFGMSKKEKLFKFTELQMALPFIISRDSNGYRFNYWYGCGHVGKRSVNWSRWFRDLHFIRN